MDVAEGGTKHAHSKNEAFDKLDQSNTWGDLQMNISIFVFYSQFLPLYDMDTRTWSYIFSKQPQPGKLSKNKYMELMQNL